MVLGEVGSFSFSLLRSVLLLILSDDVGRVGILNKSINYSFLSFQLLLWLSLFKMGKVTLCLIV